jgi:tetratricopeptide (TPR) repeat protein
VKGDGRLDSLPQMVELVTRLSPHFSRAYLFGTFALIDAGRPDVSYRILQRALRENPDDYRYPAYLGFFAYRYGKGEDKNVAAAEWYQKAAAIPGSPDYLPRLAAALMAKGGEREKAILMWGQVYTAGDKYSHERAVKELDRLLPTDKTARMKALAPLVDTMPKAELDQLIAQLFQGYE